MKIWHIVSDKFQSPYFLSILEHTNDDGKLVIGKVVYNSRVKDNEVKFIEETFESFDEDSLFNNITEFFTQKGESIYFEAPFPCVVVHRIQFQLSHAGKNEILGSIFYERPDYFEYSLISTDSLDLKILNILNGKLNSSKIETVLNFTERKVFCDLGQYIQYFQNRRAASMSSLLISCHNNEMNWATILYGDKIEFTVQNIRLNLFIQNEGIDYNKIAIFFSPMYDIDVNSKEYSFARNFNKTQFYR